MKSVACSVATGNNVLITNTQNVKSGPKKRVEAQPEVSGPPVLTRDAATSTIEFSKYLDFFNALRASSVRLPCHSSEWVLRTCVELGFVESVATKWKSWFSYLNREWSFYRPVYEHYAKLGDIDNAFKYAELAGIDRLKVFENKDIHCAYAAQGCLLELHNLIQEHIQDEDELCWVYVYSHLAKLAFKKNDCELLKLFYEKTLFKGEPLKEMQQGTNMRSDGERNRLLLKLKKLMVFDSQVSSEMQALVERYYSKDRSVRGRHSDLWKLFFEALHAKLPFNKVLSFYQRYEHAFGDSPNSTAHSELMLYAASCGFSDRVNPLIVECLDNWLKQHYKGKVVESISRSLREWQTYSGDYILDSTLRVINRERRDEMFSPERMLGLNITEEYRLLHIAIDESNFLIHQLRNVLYSYGKGGHAQKGLELIEQLKEKGLFKGLDLAPLYGRVACGAARLGDVAFFEKYGKSVQFKETFRAICALAYDGKFEESNTMLGSLIAEYGRLTSFLLQHGFDLQELTLFEVDDATLDLAMDEFPRFRKLLKVNKRLNSEDDATGLGIIPPCSPSIIYDIGLLINDVARYALNQEDLVTAISMYRPLTDLGLDTKPLSKLVSKYYVSLALEHYDVRYLEEAEKYKDMAEVTK